MGMVDSPPLRRYSRSYSPPYEAPSRSRSRSRSRSWSRPVNMPRSRSRSRSRSSSRSAPRDRGRLSEVINPGNTLYVTGLSLRVSERDLEDHFNKEGKVASSFLVMEPHSRTSRGFAFITMDTVEDADRCIKYLNQSVLDGRSITVERSRRKRPRTPTPGHYLGLNNTRGSGYRGDRGRYRGSSSREEYGYRRSPCRGGRDYSPPRHSSYRGGPDYSPTRRSSYRGGRDYSPPRCSSYRGGRDYSPPRRSSYRGGRDYSPRCSPLGGKSRRDQSRSPPYSPYHSPDRNYDHRSR